MRGQGEAGPFKQHLNTFYPPALSSSTLGHPVMSQCTSWTWPRRCHALSGEGACLRCFSDSLTKLDPRLIPALLIFPSVQIQASLVCLACSRAVSKAHTGSSAAAETLFRSTGCSAHVLTSTPLSSGLRAMLEQRRVLSRAVTGILNGSGWSWTELGLLQALDALGFYD